MINFGIDWQRTLLVVALHIPAMIVFALPAGTLMGTILVLYFMRRDGSLLALRLAGVGYARIFLPFLLVGIMATVVSYSINEFISPVALATARRLIFMAAVNTKMPLLNKDVWQTQAKPEVGKTERLILVGKTVGSDLHNIVIFDVNGKRVERIHWSPLARWTCGQVHMLNGHTFQFADGTNGSILSSSFQNMAIDLIVQAVKEREARGLIVEHQTSSQLRQMISEYRLKNQPVPHHIMIDFYKRTTQPLACVFLMLAAFPIAASHRQKGKTSGLVYGAVLITAYFLTQEISHQLGNHGRLEPLLAACLPCFALAIMTGLILLTDRLVQSLSIQRK